MLEHLDSAIDSHVPMKKQGKRSKNKHLPKEAFRKIRYKQMCGWLINIRERIMIMMLTNAATNKVRKSKRNLEHKVAPNIKSDSKSLYAYVRSKQNIQDKVGSLDENAGNIVTQGV